VSFRRLRLSKGGLTAKQKSAAGVVGHDVGKASEALQSRKAEQTDRLSRKRWLKAQTRRRG
jgi:CRISPR/Cas system-associated endonuclease Cas3-HD